MIDEIRPGAAIGRRTQDVRGRLYPAAGLEKEAAAALEEMPTLDDTVGIRVQAQHGTIQIIFVPDCSTGQNVGTSAVDGEKRLVGGAPVDHDDLIEERLEIQPLDTQV